MAEVGTNSAELRAIKKNRPKLVTAIAKQCGLGWFSQKLQEFDFITSGRASGLTSTLGVSDEDKISSLLEAVEAKIESNQRGTPFYDFVNILESEMCVRGMGETLQYDRHQFEHDYIRQIHMSMSEAEPGSTRQYSPDVTAKDSQISDLKEQLQKHLQQEEKQEERITALTEEKEKLETVVQEKTEELTQTKEQLAEKASKLEECEQKLHLERQTKEQLQKQLEEKTAELESSRKQLANKEREFEVRRDNEKEIAEPREALEVEEKAKAVEADLQFFAGIDKKGKLATEPTLKDLMDLVAAQIPSKWKLIGIQLKLRLSELNNIASGDSLLCFSSVFDLWKKKETRLPLSWETVLQALEAPSVGEQKLARKISSSLTGN